MVDREHSIIDGIDEVVLYRPGPRPDKLCRHLGYERPLSGVLLEGTGVVLLLELQTDRP